jgi:hypothetical protein
VSYTPELLEMYLRPLPGHPDSGKKITRPFATNADVLAYSEERVQAAEKYFNTRPDNTPA